MDSNTILELEKFANGLEECFSNMQKDHIGKKDTLDQMIVKTLKYAIDTVDIHLNLARIEFEREANQMAADYREDR